MEINIQSKDHKNYLKFVIGGLESDERANNHIEKIDVYYSSLSVTYCKEQTNITELLQLHNHIMDYGLDSHISVADMQNGRTISYVLED